MLKNIFIFISLLISLFLKAQNNLPFEYLFIPENNIYKINDAYKPIKGSPQIIRTYLWDTSSNNWITYDSTFYTYNSKGKILSETSKTSKIVYEYDSLNMLSKTLGFEYNTINDSWDSSFRNTNKYDDDGNKNLNIIEQYQNGNWQPFIKNKISYNYLKEETEIFIEEWDSMSNSFRKTYKYYYRYYINTDFQERIVSNVIISILDTISNKYFVKKAFVDFNWYILTTNFTTSKPKYFTKQLYSKDTSFIASNFTFDADGNQTELKRLQYTKGSTYIYDWEKDKLNYIRNNISEKIVQYFDTTESKFVNNKRYVLSNHLDINTSLSENISSKNNLSLYPNPITNFLNIESKNNKIESIQIIDLVGNFIESITVKSNRIQIDLSHLNDGIYFIQSVFENGQINKSKIILIK